MKEKLISIGLEIEMEDEKIKDLILFLKNSVDNFVIRSLKPESNESAQEPNSDHNGSPAGS